MQFRTLVRAMACTATLTFVTACAPASYAVRNPAPSGLAFTAPAPATMLTVVDNRAGSERVFSSGILPAALTVDGTPVDPTGYLARNLQAELASRGAPAEVTTSGAGFPRLDLKSFRILNHRASGFSPFVTFTFLGGDLETAAGKQRVGVFIKRGKVPQWSFEEVVEPTFNEPLSLAVKELAAKISGRLYAARSSDAEVDRLAARIDSRNDNSYLDVYALGFTNNPKAIPTMAKLARDPDEYVRLAAISSLGTLGATDHLDLLKSIHTGEGMWQDRAMALKAIGDLGTPEAKAYLDEQLAVLKTRPADKDTNWTLQVIGLYL